MNEFFKRYQIGCWHYRTTTYTLNYDPVEVQKDLGMTYAALPEHWHYGKTGIEEAALEKYMESARRLNMPVLYSDRRLFGTRAIAKPSIEKGRERLKFVKEKFGDVVKGVFIADEPWWGEQDEHKAIDACKEYVDLVRSETPEFWTFIALLGVHDRYAKGYEELRDYVDTVNFRIKFKGKYAKYDVSDESGYLSPGGAKIIDLFDKAPDPRDEVLD